ncbi:MAG: GLPGLI family protein [Rikenellaceae bacterium]
MKRIVSLILSVMLAQCLSAQFLDSAYIRCQYQTKAKNFAGSEKISEDLFFLEAGRNSSKFYSYYDFFSDSTKQSLLSLGLSSVEIFEKTKGLKRGSADKVFKNYENNSLIFVSRVIAQNYWYQEEIEKQNWELTNDTLTVHHYLCYKATCKFRGREWIVWYAPEIPMMDGPWKLGGLPGLILKADDAKGEFCFECRGISLLNSKTAIILPVEANRNKYIKTDGKTFMQIKRKSIEDLKSSLAAQGMTIVSVTDEKGLKRDIQKNLMNAIENYE